MKNLVALMVLLVLVLSGVLISKKSLAPIEPIPEGPIIVNEEPEEEPNVIVTPFEEPEEEEESATTTTATTTTATSTEV